jgi:peptidoglycan/LPS O-acetylase OafA/YrhL
VEAKAAVMDDSTPLLRFLCQHWLLHSPHVLQATAVVLTILFIMLGLPEWAIPGANSIFGGNPGSFALGWVSTTSAAESGSAESRSSRADDLLALLCCLQVVLLLLLCNTTSPLSAALQTSRQHLNLLGRLLTWHVAVTMGELSFAFYTFHLVPIVYVTSIGLQFPPSVALAFAAALGLAVPAHFYVEIPCYQWATRRLPKCGCRDDHVGLHDLHSGAQHEDDTSKKVTDLMHTETQQAGEGQVAVRGSVLQSCA